MIESVVHHHGREEELVRRPEMRLSASTACWAAPRSARCKLGTAA
jgi:hypothetical protein